MTKKWLTAAGICAIMGLLVFAAVMTVCGWDFRALSTVQYDTRMHEPQEHFSNISIQTDTADVQVLPAEDGRCRVICEDGLPAYHTVTVGGDTLTIERVDPREWYEIWGISLGTESVTVYLPAETYGKLEIRTSTADVEIGDIAAEVMDIHLSTGDIQLERVSVGTLELSVSTGDILLDDIDCKTLLSTGSTGDMLLRQVLAEVLISVERSTGDVELDDCDAAQLVFRTTTGDVTGTLRTPKIFRTETSTGDVSVAVPQSGTDEICEVKTSTGDIGIGLIKP